jgi:hypothetical protein
MHVHMLDYPRETQVAWKAGQPWPPRGRRGPSLCHVLRSSVGTAAGGTGKKRSRRGKGALARQRYILISPASEVCDGSEGMRDELRLETDSPSQRLAWRDGLCSGPMKIWPVRACRCRSCLGSCWSRPHATFTRFSIRVTNQSGSFVFATVRPDRKDRQRAEHSRNQFP